MVRRTSDRLFYILALVFAALLGSPGVARAQAVNDCQPSQFVDRSAGAAALRQIAWDFGVTSAPERCMAIKTGQTVVWDGDLDVHPLAGSGGDSPNPISSHHAGSVTFNAPGTFGFVCLAHSPMKGAIKVVGAPVAAAAPAVSFRLLALLMLALLGGGLIWIGRSIRPRATTNA